MMTMETKLSLPEAKTRDLLGNTNLHLGSLLLLKRTSHLYPPVWVDADKTDFCDTCGVKFSRTWRDTGSRAPHYCRLCGHRVCTLCSGKYLLEPRFEKKKRKKNDLPSRVCFGCRDGCLIYWCEEKPAITAIERIGYAESLVDGQVHIHLPLWRRIKSYRQCFSCMRVKMRHNCRVCGELFCHDCSIKMNVPYEFRYKKKENPSRVCLECRFRVYSGGILDPTKPPEHVARGPYPLKSFARTDSSSRRPPQHRRKQVSSNSQSDTSSEEIVGASGTCPWITNKNENDDDGVDDDDGDDDDDYQHHLALLQSNSPLNDTRHTKRMTIQDPSYFSNVDNESTALFDGTKYSDDESATFPLYQDVERRVRIMRNTDHTDIGFITLTSDTHSLLDVKNAIIEQVAGFEHAPFTLVLFGRPVFDEFLELMASDAVKARLMIAEGAPPDLHM